MSPKSATPAPEDRKDQGDDGLPFEKALERLESRVTEMESGRLSLEDMLKAFEEGRRLARLCQRKLDEVERRIEVLNRDAEGRETLTPFPETTDPSPDA